MFTLTIETDNAAFTGNPGAEVARILSDIAHYLTAGGVNISNDDGKVRDRNGNTVGNWELTGPRKWARCNACGGEVIFDAWADYEGNTTATFDNTYCGGCDGDVGYCYTVVTGEGDEVVEVEE